MPDIQQQIYSELDKFAGLSESAGKILHEAAGKIDGGYSPSGTEISQLFSSLKGLRQLYENICSLIASESTDTELLQKELSVSELRAITAGLNETVETAKEDLRRFIQIRSSMEAFSNHIRPSQEKASKLLQKMETQNLTGSAKKSALNESLKYQKFIAMLDQELTEGNISNAEELTKVFPPMTVVGLTSNHYYIDGESTKPAPPKESHEPQKSHESQKPKESPEPQRVAQESSVQAAPAEIPNDTGNIIPPNTPIKPKKAGAKAFREEIIRNAHSMGKEAMLEVRDLLNIFMHYGVLTLDQVFGFGVFYRAWHIKDDSERQEYIREKLSTDSPDYAEAARGVIEWLERRKAIASFRMADKDIFCLTKWMCDSLAKKDVRKTFTGLAPGNFLYSADDGLPENEAVGIMCNNYYVQTYLASVLYMADRDRYTRILDGVKCAPGKAIAPVFYEGNEYKCRVVPSAEEARKTAAAFPDDDILMAAVDPPEKINAELMTLDPALRERIFVADKTLHRGLCEITPPEDDSDSDSAPEESYYQLGFDFGDDEPGHDSQPVTAPEITAQESEPAPEITAQESESAPETTAQESESVPEITATESEPVPEDSESGMIPIPSDSDLLTEIRAMLNDTDCGNDEIPYPSIASAIITAKAASLTPGYAECAGLFSRLDMAAPVLPDSPEYTGANLSAIFPDSLAGDTVSEGLMLSAYLGGMMFPEMPYSDFELKRRADELNDNYGVFFPSYRETKKIFARVCEFFRRYSEFPAAFLESANRKENDSGILSRIKSEAESLLNVPAFNKDMKLLPFFTREFFGPAGEIYSCLKTVADDDSSGTERVRAFVDKYYDTSEKMSGEKMKDLIDTKWAEVWREKSVMPGKLSPLISHLRTGVIRAAYVRLAIMQKWLAVKDSESRNFDTDALTAARDEILALADDAMQKLSGMAGKSVVIMTLDRIRRKLTCQPEPVYFAVLLTNGIIPLDSDNSPVLGMKDVKYYEPLRNVVRFLNATRLTLEEAERKILYDDESPMFENLHQLEIIRKIQGRDTDLGDDGKRARESAEKFTEDFRLQIMTDYAFGRISEDDAETFKALISGNDSILALGDFGCWRQFLDAIRHQAEDVYMSRQAVLTDAIFERMAYYHDKNPKREMPGYPEDLDTAMSLAVNGSLNAAESLFSRCESARAMGLTVADIRTERTEIDAFSKFMEKFPEIYGECKKPGNKEKALKNFGRSYIESNPPAEWAGLTRKLKDERTAIIDNWPSGLGYTTPEQIRALVTGLGFTADPSEDSVRKDGTESNMEFFTVKIKRNDGRICPHPIAKFGTKLESLNVIVLYGSGTPEKIVSSVMEREPGASILIMDYHVSLTERSQYAKAFRTHDRQDKYFLLIDRVLALFLTLQDTGNRFSVMLQCTLPYTSCIPFTKGSGYVAPEMFYGRERELADIRSPEGSSIVYGGRQLGKTSLLKRAETLEHQPEKLKFAVYNDLTVNGLKQSFQEGYNESEFTANIIRNVNAKIPGLLRDDSNTLQAMCENIAALIADRKAESFMLLLDEADAFLDSIREANYEPLRPLVNLRNSTRNKFRFVLAGLHNVMRAKNSAADNNPLGQLGTALCIRPLSPFEAQRLLLEPLEYIGFRIDPERHLETILTATNYYPGVIQYFGYTLLEKFTERCANSGTEEISPPFSADDSLLGSVIASQELNEAAAQTLRLSLSLDKYFMLGQCIAYLYYIGGGETSGAFRGYSVNEIAEADAGLTQCMTGESYDSYDAILREMSDMGILSRLENGSYRFRRQSFIKSIWPDEDSVLRTGE